MLKGLIVRHFPLPNSQTIPVEAGAFVLKTCQRTLVVAHNSTLGQVEGADSYVSDKAYSLLLEVICGLKSSIVAETEIVQQFKSNYREYMQRPDRNSKLIRILERIFKDAKKIRAEHLMTVGGRSYASICKKIVKQNSNSKKILLLGSGALAKDIVKACSKEHNIHISARNEEAVSSLISETKIEAVPWDSPSVWKEYGCIVNTIGAQKVLFDEGFFDNWRDRHECSSLFVDLGSPSTISTPLDKDSGIYRLTDVLNYAKETEVTNQQYVTNAIEAIDSISKYRIGYFNLRKESSALAVLGEQKCQSIE